MAKLLRWVGNGLCTGFDKSWRSYLVLEYVCQMMVIYHLLTGNGDGWVIMIDSTGGTIWERNYGGTRRLVC
ncbi:MAG: hypothetical protein R2764_16350 [Bacteroidales bacterium]